MDWGSFSQVPRVGEGGWGPVISSYMLGGSLAQGKLWIQVCSLEDA